MARPAFVVTDAMREKAQYLAGLGVPQDDIAKMVGCAPKTLRKRFREELDRGQCHGCRLSVQFCKAGQRVGADLLAENKGTLAGGSAAGPNFRH